MLQLNFFTFNEISIVVVVVVVFGRARLKGECAPKFEYTIVHLLNFSILRTLKFTKAHKGA